MAIYTIRDHDLILDNEERKYILRVRDLPPEDKPREKLVRYGPHELSLEELFAVILNVGSKKEGVLALSSRILKEYGEKSIVSQTNPQKMADALDQALSDLPFAEKMISQGLNRIKYFTWTRTAQSTLDFYHSIGSLTTYD